VAELRYEAPVAYTTARFAAPAEAAHQADRLNDVVQVQDRLMRSHFGFKALDVRKRIALAAALPPEPSARVLEARGADGAFRQAAYVQIVPKRSADCARLAAALSKEKSVWKAHVAPRPCPRGCRAARRGRGF
jgi:hypothetical protein